MADTRTASAAFEAVGVAVRAGQVVGARLLVLAEFAPYVG